MKINTQKDGNSLLVIIDGSIDTVTAPELEKHLESQWDGITELVLDFDAVDYISSAGLRVILAADKHMSRNGSMKIRNIHDETREVFEMTGFRELLTFE